MLTSFTSEENIPPTPVPTKTEAEQMEGHAR